MTNKELDKIQEMTDSKDPEAWALAIALLRTDSDFRRYLKIVFPDVKWIQDIFYKTEDIYIYGFFPGEINGWKGYENLIVLNITTSGKGYRIHHDRIPLQYIIGDFISFCRAKLK